MYCTYTSSHKSGLYYRGNTSVANILKGYRGSGSEISETFKVYPKGEWECRIDRIFDTKREAMDFEKVYITEEDLQDPKCLNKVHGGSGTDKTPWKDKPLSEEHREKISQALKGIKRPYKPKSEAHKEAIRQAKLGKKQPNISAARKGHGHPQTPETRAKISRALTGIPKGPRNG